MKQKTIIKRSTESNIPVLKTDTYTFGTGNVTFGFSDKTTGIYAPFEGVFLVKFHVVPSSESRTDVKIDNIYGEARTLYIDKTTAVGLGNISTSAYLCYFDTDERRLYLVQ